jgi:hypothetical protein
MLLDPFTARAGSAFQTSSRNIVGGSFPAPKVTVKGILEVTRLCSVLLPISLFITYDQIFIDTRKKIEH